MKTLPQIAFDFATDNNSRQDASAELSSTAQSKEQIAGVGVRLKHKKNIERTAPETPEMENPAPIIEVPLIEATHKSPPPPPEKAKSTRGRKSLKQVSAEADLIEIPSDEELFSKQYYTMGEVAAMFKVNQSLLRFWEAEFDILKPRKNKKGDRYFRPVDIKNLHLIYHLLRQRKYTIEGAIEFLKNSKKAEAKFEAIRRLQEIRAFLLELKAQI